MGRCILRNLVDIFGEVVAGLGKLVHVNSVSVSGNVYTFSVDYTYWLRPKTQKSLATKIIIDSVSYDIDSVVYNQSVTVISSTDLTNTSSFTINAPVYYNGTKIATNKRRKGQNSFNICPFVWIVEPFVTNENKDRLSIIAAEPNIQIFFLDNRKFDNWITSDAYSNVILQMDELAQAFYEKMRNTRSVFGKITNWRVVRHAIFGKDADNGKVSSIFDETLAGVEVNFSVEILKELISCQE